jgi:hypothetical protein
MPESSSPKERIQQGREGMDENIKKKVDEGWKDKIKQEPQEAPADAGQQKETPEPSFRLFVTSLAMQAWIALGAIPNPMTDKTEEDITQAKFLIDSLEMLEKKTKGNLDKRRQKCSNISFMNTHGICGQIPLESEFSLKGPNNESSIKDKP